MSTDTPTRTAPLRDRVLATLREQVEAEYGKEALKDLSQMRSLTRIATAIAASVATPAETVPVEAPHDVTTVAAAAARVTEFLDRRAEIFDYDEIHSVGSLDGDVHMLSATDLRTLVAALPR